MEARILWERLNQQFQCITLIVSLYMDDEDHEKVKPLMFAIADGMRELQAHLGDVDAD